MGKTDGQGQEFARGRRHVPRARIGAKTGYPGWIVVAVRDTAKLRGTSR
jgi:hypothetical protein